ncbi:flagellar hook-basal body protein [Fervidobacterium thailandense]|uniref:Flagellar biosynthesis protein FlgF n=1 Tax=Fervidobacterium thailandense TaxID=1008305 RepID=A0A1E3G2N0_9BACT|nr:flagellar hook-basal body protein [Fervidobacterium thailandense]ODN30469.1 flagellar biosynthesis protein FlgF [Fervidobacterium thailandense]
MYRGVYTAAMGMLVDLTKIDTISNNLANVETNGYKTDTPAFRTYLEREILRLKPEPENRRLEVKRIGRLEQAIVLDEVRTVFDQGTIEFTGVPTHFAISGEGFFAVRRGGEILYTRNGEFLVDQNRRLVTSQGHAVLDVNGNEIIFPENAYVDGNGDIRDANGNFIARIAVYNLENPRKIGDTFFTGTQVQAGEFRILQGYIEKSNVNAVREMVRLIDAHRHYEATSKAIVVHDELLNKIINNVGALR